MHILDIQGATVFRGPNQVLQDFSLKIKLGDNTAIIGPNGAGKSTLLKVLARELYPSKGKVRIFERDRWNVWELRKRLGLVSPDLQQNYSPAAKGFAVVLSGFHSSVDIYGHQKFEDQHIATAERVVSELGIEHLREKPFSKMSTGEQRRHLLGRALVNEPEALILDEPTSGLDLPATFQYLETARSLMQSGKTLILVTHHLHEIPPEITHVVFLKQGKPILHGLKEDVMTSESLSDLFDVSVELVTKNGYYQVMPKA